MGISRCKAAAIALGSSQFQHGLDIFSEKLRFDGKFVGVVTVNDLERTSENALQLDIGIGDFLNIQHSGHNQLWFFRFSESADDGVSHKIGAGVDTHN